MCLSTKRKKEQIMVGKINEIIEETSYTLVLYKKDYKHFGNCIIKFVSPGKKNIKIITDKNDIIFNDQCYSKLQYGNLYNDDRDVMLLDFIKLIFSIVKLDDWRLTGQENYLLFKEVKEIIPQDYINSLEKPQFFHEHCEFCMNKIEENKDKSCYCTLDNYHWICKECFNDFKDKFKFKIKK